MLVSLRMYGLAPRLRLSPWHDSLSLYADRGSNCELECAPTCCLRHRPLILSSTPRPPLAPACTGGRYIWPDRYSHQQCERTVVAGKITLSDHTVRPYCQTVVMPRRQRPSRTVQASMNVHCPSISASLCNTLPSYRFSQWFPQWFSQWFRQWFPQWLCLCACCGIRMKIGYCGYADEKV